MADNRNEMGELKDQVVFINRVTKVVKGGKNFSFSALVVVGDGNGWVGFASGKAREVPSAIAKGVDQAKRNVFKVQLKGGSIPHEIMGRYGAGRVLLKPASPGTGVIAGGAVRPVLEWDPLGWSRLKSIEQVAKTRDKELDVLRAEAAK